MRQAILFANLRSGGARTFGRTLRVLSAAGVEVAAVEFDLDRGSIRDAVDRWTRREVSLVLAFGGDGTVGSVVDAIAGQDVTLGILAAGTSNNFARSLGITPSVRNCVDTIVNGGESLLDLGEMNGRCFAHAAIMGLNVEFARRAQPLRRVMGRLSYPVASVLVYRSRQSLKVRIEEGSTIRELVTYQLSLLNQPRTGPDHRLRVLTVHDLRLRTIVHDLPEIFFERHLGLPGANGFEVEECRITTEEPLPLTLDGEIRTETPAEVRVLRNGLRVMKPVAGAPLC